MAKHFDCHFIDLTVSVAIMTTQEDQTQTVSTQTREEAANATQKGPARRWIYTVTQDKYKNML